MTEIEKLAKEEQARYKKEWAEKNKEHLAQYHKKWRNENKDKVREYKHRYWLKKAMERKNMKARDTDDTTTNENNKRGGGRDKADGSTNGCS